MISESSQSYSGSSEQWKTALPAIVPEATFAPAFLALGITFLLFGIVSSYIFSAAGLILIVWSISKWIGELLRGDTDEPRTESD
jgi:membrane-bound ClpP family serine protease